MKKKIMLFFCLLGLSAISYSDVDLSKESNRKEAEKILENKRKKIQMEEKERKEKEEEAQKFLKEKQEKENLPTEEQALNSKETKENGQNVSNEKIVAAYLKEKEALAKKEKEKLKTPLEKLESTHKKALEKIDFYERVVRSVAREEKEINSFKEIVNSDI